MQGGEYIRFPFEEETEELINKEEEEEYYPREFDIDFTTGKLTGRRKSYCSVGIFSN